MSDLRTAAQQALEFVTSEVWGTTPYMDVRVYEEAAKLRDALKAALAEPVQGCPSCEYNKARAQLWRHEAYKAGGHPLDWEPELMVRPKPLTDDEVVALFNRLCKERPAYPERRYRDFARWVEAAHGIGEKK